MPSGLGLPPSIPPTTHIPRVTAGAWLSSCHSSTDGEYMPSRSSLAVTLGHQPSTGWPLSMATEHTPAQPRDVRPSARSVWPGLGEGGGSEGKRDVEPSPRGVPGCTPGSAGADELDSCPTGRDRLPPPPPPSPSRQSRRHRHHRHGHAKAVATIVTVTPKPPPLPPTPPSPLPASSSSSPVPSFPPHMEAPQGTCRPVQP